MLFALLLLGQEFRHAPTAEYRQETIEGFKVMISPTAVADPEKLDPVRKKMGENLKEIKRLLPRRALAKLAGITIWVEHDNPKNPGAVFHPSADWLRENGYNTDKAGCIEIGNLEHFVAWQKVQPMMLLHELSHAWEFRFASKEAQREVVETYQAAKKSGRYESVEYALGGKKRAYGLNNEHEFFAELSEAYFGRNDFYPFVREDLKTFDPEGYRMVRDAWGIR